METRKITIVSTKSNSKSVIESMATTLGELKADLREAGIDYSDMTFYEGLTKTELVNDESVLPHDVMYKGQTTNELVFMLTNTNKKIKSGSIRTDLYDLIRNNSLQDKVMEHFGKNFTLVKTADLEQFIAELQKASASKEESAQCPIVEILDSIIEDLYDTDSIYSDSYYKWKSFYKNINSSVEEDNSSYSNDDINEMFKGMF